MTSAPLGALDVAAALARLVGAAMIHNRPQMLAEMLSATVDLLGRHSARLRVETSAGPLEITTTAGTEPSPPQVLRHWDYALTAPGDSSAHTTSTSDGPAAQIPIGHLVIEDCEGREMTDIEEHLAASTALVLGTLLAQTRAFDAAEQVIAQLGTALRSRVVLEQATGVLVERHGITTDAAFELLRSTARQRRCTIQYLARELMTGAPREIVTDTRNPPTA